MAKKSKVIKAQKQLAMVEKYAELRKELKEKGDYAALAKLPRDSSPTRVHNRCGVTGGPVDICANSTCRVSFLGNLLIKGNCRVSKSQAGEAGSSRSFIRKGALVKEGLLSL